MDLSRTLDVRVMAFAIRYYRAASKPKLGFGNLVLQDWSCEWCIHTSSIVEAI